MPSTAKTRKRVLLLLAYYDYRHHSGVARYAAEHGWILEDAFTQLRSVPDSWEGDGIISFHASSPPFIEYLSKATVPVVDIGEHDDQANFPRIKTDTEKIAKLALDHFGSRGYKNIAFVHKGDHLVKRRRLEATRKTAQARGMSFADVELDGIAALSQRMAFPIGMLAVNDSIAVRALRECEDAGIMVPEQIALLGIDNFEYRCVPASVPLSSIDPDQERVGYEAAALLDKLMAGKPAPETPVLVPPIGIVQRDSTDMLAVADLEVAISLRYIIQNYRKRVGLREVAKATTISLRRLQTRFKEALGRTILQEINTRRVAYAKHLLATTTKKIRMIATECGFGSSVKLIRVFRQYANTSPKRYRKQVKKTEKTPAAEG